MPTCYWKDTRSMGLRPATEVPDKLDRVRPNLYTLMACLRTAVDAIHATSWYAVTLEVPPSPSSGIHFDGPVSPEQVTNKSRVLTTLSLRGTA